MKNFQMIISLFILGFGVSIIRQIMELVDGKVYLDTTYSGRARFVVEWPQ